MKWAAVILYSVRTYSLYFDSHPSRMYSVDSTIQLRKSIPVDNSPDSLSLSLYADSIRTRRAPVPGQQAFLSAYHRLRSTFPPKSVSFWIEFFRAIFFPPWQTFQIFLSPIQSQARPSLVAMGSDGAIQAIKAMHGADVQPCRDAAKNLQVQSIIAAILAASHIHSPLLNSHLFLGWSTLSPLICILSCTQLLQYPIFCIMYVAWMESSPSLCPHLLFLKFDTFETELPRSRKSSSAASAGPCITHCQ